MGKLTDAQLPRINCYETSGDVVLANLRWVGDGPGALGAFKTLLAQADAAFSGELAGYDVTDYAPTAKAPAGAPIAAVAANTASGVHFLGGPERLAFFPTDFPKAPKVVFARAEPDTAGGEWGGSPIVGDGIAFAAAGGGYVHNFAALDPKSGKTLEAHALEAAVLPHQPATKRGRSGGCGWSCGPPPRAPMTFRSRSGKKRRVRA